MAIRDESTFNSSLVLNITEKWKEYLATYLIRLIRSNTKGVFPNNTHILLGFVLCPFWKYSDPIFITTKNTCY